MKLQALLTLPLLFACDSSDGTGEIVDNLKDGDHCPPVVEQVGTVLEFQEEGPPTLRPMYGVQPPPPPAPWQDEWTSFCGSGLPPWVEAPALPTCEGEGYWDLFCVLARRDAWDDTVEACREAACSGEVYCDNVVRGKMNAAWIRARTNDLELQDTFTAAVSECARQYREDGDFLAYESCVNSASADYDVAAAANYAAMLAEIAEYRQEYQECMGDVGLTFAGCVWDADQTFLDSICECWVAMAPR